LIIAFTLLLPDIPAAIVINTWAVDRNADGMPVYSDIRPCGSGYQRIHSVPQWLPIAVIFASLVLPAAWIEGRVRKTIAALRSARTPRRGFEVVLKHPTEKHL